MARVDELTGEIKAPTLFELTDELAVLFEADAELQELESYDPFEDDDFDATQRRQARIAELIEFMETAWSAVDELGPKVDGYLYRRDQLLAEADALEAEAARLETIALGIRGHAKERLREADSLLERLLGVMRRFDWPELKGVVRRLKWKWSGGAPKIAILDTVDKDDLGRKAFVAGYGTAELTIKVSDSDQLKQALTAFDAASLAPKEKYALATSKVSQLVSEDKSKAMDRSFSGLPDWLAPYVEVSRGGKAEVQ